MLEMIHYFSLYIVIFLLNNLKHSPIRHSVFLNFSVPDFYGPSYFPNLFALLFFDVILIQRGHAAQTVYDRFDLLYNEVNVLFCDLLT